MRAAGRAPREGGSDWLASHPTSEQRLREITEIANQYKAAANYTDEGRDRYLQAINGLPFGDSPDQGVTRGQNFYHEPLGIALTAPPGWKIQNSPQALALVNGEGNAAVIVRAVPPKAGSSHEEIIRNAVKPDSGKMERRTFNGLPATHFSGTAKNERGQSQAIELTIATGPSNTNYAFIYAAKDQQSLQRAYRQIQEAESSFRALTEADRNAARSWKLKTVPYPPGGFAELAKQSPLTSNAEQQLRLLNGVYGGGDVKPGQPVKVVE